MSTGRSLMGMMVACAVFGAGAAVARGQEAWITEPPAPTAPSEAQDLLPLASVLDRIMPGIEGEVGASRLIKDHGTWVYVIGFFDENGKPQELRVDAITAQILGIRQ